MFSLEIALISMYAEQMLDKVQFIHERNFVHRNLKPHNLALGEYGLEQEKLLCKTW